MTTKPNTLPTEHVVRLDATTYRELEKLLPTSKPGTDSSPQHVGFLLGVQHTLSVLRQGFVVGG